MLFKPIKYLKNIVSKGAFLLLNINNKVSRKKGGKKKDQLHTMIGQLTLLCNSDGNPSLLQSLTTVLIKSKFGSCPFRPSILMLKACTESPAISRFNAA